MDRRKFVLKAVASASSLGVSSHAATPKSKMAHPVAVALLPASSVSAEPRQFLTWDGGSGPSRDYWSQKLLLPWVNRGKGDWLDARLEPQGPLAFAAATVAGGAVSLNVTDLVNRWIGSGQNRGFYLKSSQAWPTTFAGRTHGTVAARPRLTLVNAAGSVDLDCICNASWSPSSYQGKDSRATFSVAEGNQFAIVQFDVSRFSEPVQSALLTLTCVSLKYPGTLEVFELRPPEFRIGRGRMQETTGIASGFTKDRGIAAHPSVLFAGDFSDLSKMRWQSGTIAAGSSQVLDPTTGSTYVRSLIPKGQLLGCDLERNIIQGTPAGLPDKVETALYARYYFFLEEDWGSEVDANKMPGWDGRMGWWNPVGYWQGTTGNGGARPTGLKVRNVTMNRWEYQGASMRGHGGTRTNDGNPYDDIFWIGNYIYHLDQATNYGEAINWIGTVVAKGRWHCVEQYIKMNSIIGPFDNVGNGVAVKDGQYTVWVDGAIAYERTNFRWRRHPEMGIQGFWLNWYHGGTAAAPRDMHFRMDSVVIARSYIGPRNGAI